MKPDNVASPTHPLGLWLLKTLLLLLGISALIPGIEMILDPTGKSIGFPEGALANSPFYNYRIPGFILTAFIGLLSLSAWYALWKKPNLVFLERLNPIADRHWAWTAALISGLVLIIWILVQMQMVPYFFLQPLMLSWGVMIVLLCYAPGVRGFYKPA